MSTNQFCVPLPKPIDLTIPLPFGVELRAITDASRPPNDCAIVHSLMLQISPMLASMTCLIRVLQVIDALKKAVSTVPPDFGNLIKTIEELASCFFMFDPCELSKTVSGILCMLLAYLNCIIEAFDSLLTFQAGINLDADPDNADLTFNLSCAQDNAQKAMDGVTSSMTGMKPIVDMVNILLDIIGQPPIALPTGFATPSADQLLGEDPLAPLKTLRDVISGVNSALPCKVC